MAVPKCLTPSSGDSETQRRWGHLTVTLDTTLGDTPPIDIRGYDKLSIYVPAGVTTLTFYSLGVDQDGTPELIQDAGTSGVQTVTADTWNLVDDAVFPHGFIKIVPNADNAACILVGKS